LGPVTLLATDRPATGGPIDIRVQARYASGRKTTGVVPLQVEVQSADGAISDYSQFTATAANGSWSASIPVADNEPPGTWVAQVTELIGGHTTTASFTVEPVPLGERASAVGPELKTIALWRFDGKNPMRDVLGGTYKTTLRGRSRVVENGKAGGGLECFAATEDRAEGLEIARDPKLSPEGRFAVELWLKPKPAMAENKLTMLLDCNYYLQTRDHAKANTGFAFYLSRERDGLRPRVVLGFGNETRNIPAHALDLKAGTWYRLGFKYDGKGAVTIYLNGREIGRGRCDAGPVAPARHSLTIGGRVGSTHCGCAAIIDEVRLAGE